MILNIDVSVDTELSLGFSASGSLIPPKLDQFSSFIGKNYIPITYPKHRQSQRLLDLSLNSTGVLGVLSDVVGEIDSGLVSLFSELLGELNVPGYDVSSFRVLTL